MGCCGHNNWTAKKFAAAQHPRNTAVKKQSPKPPQQQKQSGISNYRAELLKRAKNKPPGR